MRIVMVTAKKYDGKPYRRVNARLIESKQGFVHLRVDQNAPVWDASGSFTAPRAWDWYFWTDRWYNIALVYEADGSIHCWYCNITSPPEIRGHEVSYVDLDLDLLVRPDYSMRMMDEDEFELHKNLYQYPPDLVERVHQAMADLQERLGAREYPFDVSVRVTRP